MRHIISTNLPKKMFLKNKKYLFDGGSGQTLMEMGLETTGDLWSAQALLNENNHPMVVEMHKNFINAGSQLIVTSNFSVRRRLLKKYPSNTFKRITTIKK